MDRYSVGNIRGIKFPKCYLLLLLNDNVLCPLHIGISFEKKKVITIYLLIKITPYDNFPSCDMPSFFSLGFSMFMFQLDGKIYGVEMFIWTDMYLYGFSFF